MVGDEGLNAPDRGLTTEARVGPRTLAGLYGELYEPMVRLAYLLTGSSAVAENLVQDSFVRLHQRWSRV